MKSITYSIVAIIFSIFVVNAAFAFPPQPGMRTDITFVNMSAEAINWYYQGVCGVSGKDGVVAKDAKKTIKMDCGFENNGIFSIVDTSGTAVATVADGASGCHVQSSASNYRVVKQSHDKASCTVTIISKTA